MIEVWKQSRNHPDFEISNFGRVKNIKTGNIRKPSNNGEGYYFVGYREKNNYKKVIRFYIHREVADLFISRIKPTEQINHKDFDPSNNKVDNLEITTPKQNINYSINHGRYDEHRKRHSIFMTLNNPRKKLK